MRIRLLSSAVEDLRRGADFYDSQAEGLGSYFLDSLFSDTASLEMYSGIHPQVFGHYRLLSKRFPYAIYYVLDEDCAVVRRILDMRRAPRRTEAALQE